MKLSRNKKFNFIVSIALGLIIAIITNVFAANGNSNLIITSAPLFPSQGSIGNVQTEFGPGGVYTLWFNNVMTQVNNNTKYLNTLFTTPPTQTLTQYINSGISSNSAITTLNNNFATLFGSASPNPNQTIQAYIDSEISEALVTLPAGPSTSPTGAYAAVQNTINYFINQAFSNSASPSYAAFQTAVNSFAGTVITNALAPASTSTPAGSIMAAINSATNNFASISSVASSLSSGSTTMPSAVDNYIQTELGSNASNQTIQTAVNSFLGLIDKNGNTQSLKKYIDSLTVDALTAPAKGSTPTTAQTALSKTINSAITPLQNNFATLFGTDKNGKANIPTQTLGNYIRAGTTTAIVNALNTQNPKSNSPAQQLQSAVTSVVAPTITQAFTTALALPSKSLPTGGSVTQAISTAVTAVSSELPKDINSSGTAINKAMNQFIQFYLSPSNSTFQSAVNSLISSNPAVTALQTRQTKNTNDINTINNTTIPNLTGENGVVTQAISNAISPLQANFTTIFGPSPPSGNLQSYLNNGVAFALSNDSKTGLPNSGNSQSAVQSVVASALGGSGTDVQSAVSSSVASALEAGSTSITSAVHKYIQKNFLTPPSSSSGTTTSWPTFQSAVQTANQGANGFWYANNLNNLQTTLNNAGAVASATNPQTVRLAAGNYLLGSTTLTIPSYVTLEGVGELATQLIASDIDESTYLVQMQPNSILANLSVVNNTSLNAATNGIALNCDTPSGPACNFTLSHVIFNFFGNDYSNPSTIGLGNAITLVDNQNSSGSPIALSVTINLDSSFFYASSILNNSSTATFLSSSVVNAINNRFPYIPSYGTKATGCNIFNTGLKLVTSNNTGIISGNVGEDRSVTPWIYASCQ